MEFVGEFWRVLPDALNDVIENSDEFGRKAALRLVSEVFWHCSLYNIVNIDASALERTALESTALCIYSCP